MFKPFFLPLPINIRFSILLQKYYIECSAVFPGFTGSSDFGKVLIECSGDSGG